MRKKIPYSLMKISNSLKFVVFVVVFAFVFILTLNLQGSEKFAAIKTKDIFAAHAAIVSAIGLIVLLISRIALNIVYKKNDSETITYGTYIIWIVAEIVAISLFCNLYAWLVSKNIYGINISYFTMLGDTLTYSVSILALPYIITTLYFELLDKNMYIEKFRRKTGIIAEENPEKKQIAFSDEKGALKLSVNVENLFYIESADNYVNICYKNKDRITKFCLRNSLKNIESMENTAELVRCHRKYIVNLNKVTVIKKEKTGLYIELEDKEIEDIPVSKTYAQHVLDQFSA